MDCSKCATFLAVVCLPILAFSARGLCGDFVTVRGNKAVWPDGREVLGWGVNYYAGLSTGYMNIKRLGLDHKKQMDTDLAHLRLMGVDVIRLHVLDIEISDKKGNLIDNVHLDLLDYLLHKGAQAGGPRSWSRRRSSWCTPADCMGSRSPSVSWYS